MDQEVNKLNNLLWRHLEELSHIEWVVESIDKSKLEEKDNPHFEPNGSCQITPELLKSFKAYLDNLQLLHKRRLIFVEGVGVSGCE